MIALSNYSKRTPPTAKCIGDVMLFSAPLLSGAVMAAPFTDEVKMWVVFGLNVILVIGKIITKFYAETDTDITPDINQ